MRRTPNRDERARRAARREARENGYEYRPTTAATQREAERLRQGFALLSQAGDEDYGTPEEDIYDDED